MLPPHIPLPLRLLQEQASVLGFRPPTIAKVPPDPTAGARAHMTWIVPILASAASTAATTGVWRSLYLIKVPRRPLSIIPSRTLTPTTTILERPRRRKLLTTLTLTTGTNQSINGNPLLSSTSSDLPKASCNSETYRRKRREIVAMLKDEFHTLSYNSKTSFFHCMDFSLIEMLRHYKSCRSRFSGWNCGRMIWALFTGLNEAIKPPSIHSGCLSARALTMHL